MNKILFVTIIAVAVVSHLFANEGKIVIPKYKNVSIYQNMPRLLNEKPIFEVNDSDHLTIIDNNECCYLILDTQGRKGWVEKNKCSKILTGRKLNFDAAVVEGFSDFFSPHLVFGKTSGDELQLKLSRSFRENLRDNVDREEIMRIVNKINE